LALGPERRDRRLAAAEGPRPGAKVFADSKGVGGCGSAERTWRIGETTKIAQGWHFAEILGFALTVGNSKPLLGELAFGRNLIDIIRHFNFT
jgi:hypothetical protein